MMDSVICYMLFYFEYHHLINLLMEFNIIPNDKFKPNVQMQAMRILDNGCSDGIDIQKYTKRIIEVFNQIRNVQNISAQDPYSLKTRMVIATEITTHDNVLQTCINRTNNMSLKIPYENIECLINPTVLIGESAGAQRNAIFYFHLSPDELVNILRNTRNLVNDRTYQLHIRICLLEPSTEEEIDYLPPGISIHLNATCKIFPFETISNIDHRSSVIKQHSIDFTDSISSSKNLNTITVSWTPDYKTYGVAIYLIKIPVISSNLIDEFQNNIKNISKKTIKEMIEMIEMNSDLPAVKYCISLNCPITKKRIKLPVISVNCNHLQCFDARTYILLNEDKPMWKCPICYKCCTLDDLQIQNYLLEILKSADLPDDANNIELLHNGTWSVHYQTKNQNKVVTYMDIDDNSIDSEVNKTIHVIDLSSDSEEDNKQNIVQIVDATQTVNLQSQAPGQSQHQSNNVHTIPQTSSIQTNIQPQKVFTSPNINNTIITIDVTSDFEENDLNVIC